MPACETSGVTGGESRQVDRWARWLTQGRDAGLTQEQRQRTADALEQLAERVLGAADIGPGDAVLDVGAGTGLLSLQAAARVGTDGLSCALDLSHDALAECDEPPEQPTPALSRWSATAWRCRSGPRCSRPPSVLIYVADKQSTIAEFHRGRTRGLVVALGAHQPSDARLPGGPPR